MAIRAKKAGCKGILLPLENAQEAALVKGIELYGLSHIRELINFMQSDSSIDPIVPKENFHLLNTEFDFGEVKGQHQVKRALEIAAAGGHNILLTGPPGIGKNNAGQKDFFYPSSPMTSAEAQQTTQIYTVSEKIPAKGLITERPFRSPHHTISNAGLAGGGPIPTPGELTLAHNGVLFLDELPEFRRSAIEVLRQPMGRKKNFNWQG